MEYWKKVEDTNGFVWSIDNLEVEYWMKNPVKCIISDIQSISKEYTEDIIEYKEQLDLKRCSKFNNFNNYIHLRYGISLFIGKYTLFFDKSKEPQIISILRLKVNPNKHYNKSIFQKLLSYILKYQGDATLKKFDLALDIKTKITNIEVFGSRKEKGLCKGTRYFGQRNQHGYCKIYDKQKEQKLDYELTRIEHTIEPNVHDRKASTFFENVYINTKDDKDVKLNNTLKVLCDLICVCNENKIDISDKIDMLDKRTKKSIFENLNGMYKKIDLNIDAYNYLKQCIYETFIQRSYIEEVENGFIEIKGDYDLPFD